MNRAWQPIHKFETCLGGRWKDGSLRWSWSKVLVIVVLCEIVVVSRWIVEYRREAADPWCSHGGLNMEGHFQLSQVGYSHLKRMVGMVVEHQTGDCNFDPSNPLKQFPRSKISSFQIFSGCWPTHEHPEDSMWERRVFPDDRPSSTPTQICIIHDLRETEAFVFWDRSTQIYPNHP